MWDDCGHVVGNEHKLFVTHHHALLGFAKTDWRHFGAILQSVHRRWIDKGWKGEKGGKEEIQGLCSDVMLRYQNPVHVKLTDCMDG